MSDSYRPQRRNAPDRSLANRITFGDGGGGGGGDSYRPGRDRSEFTFSAGSRGPQFPPTGPADMQERGARRMQNRGGARAAQNDRNYARNGNSRGSYGGRGNFGRAPFRGGMRGLAPHQRPLLQSRDDTIEKAVGVAESSSKFNLDNLSEDSEADMDLETDQSDDEEGPRKTVRTQSNFRADGDSVPKWCNPDPYTSLPPPEEGTGKRVNFVKLIRKAKNDAAAEKEDETNAVVANDDFISFGGDGADDGDDNADEDVVEIPPSNRDDQVLGSLNDIGRPAAVPEGRSSLSTNNGRGLKRSAENADLPDRPQGRPVRRRRGDNTDGGVIPEWQPVSEDCTPWLNGNPYKEMSNNPSKWLHNEILDFYEWIAPRAEEDDLRRSLVNRIEGAFDKSQFRPHYGHLQPFGSFPTGLYLPCADMDLVYRSERYYSTGEKTIQITTSKLWRIARALEARGVATNIQVIGRAKVPIIKFVETLTNINVDISFENLGGVDAVEVVREWVEKYPDCIYLVALVKQFLVMRGLNEVNTQGLGGFSTICLAVSYLQQVGKVDDVAVLFLGFLDYYGNKFDLAKQRIVMDPPRIVAKGVYGIDGRKEQDDGLSIQDPNDPQNNISGGSRKVKLIFDLFAQAHADITDRMEQISKGEISVKSILEPVFGGNYRVYEEHRDFLRRVRTS